MTKYPDTRGNPKSQIQKESFLAGLIVLAFLLINLLTAARVPTVFMDEVMYVDPAANLYFGDGFTSTMWQQDRHAFWCGNVPLHQALLYCDFKLFGFGLLQARMLTAVLAAAGAWLIWCALRRSGFVQSPGLRLFVMVALLSGSASTMTFRLVRYDAFLFFLCALVFFAATLPRRWGASYIAIFLTCLFMPAAGMPLIPFGCLMGFLYAIVYGRRNLGLPVAWVAGLAAGIVALFLFYNHFGVWHQFVEIVLPFTGAGKAQADHRALKTILIGDKLGDESLLTSFFGNPTRFLDPKTLFDWSAFICFLMILFVIFKTWRAADAAQRRLMVFIVLVTLVTPPFMHLAGHYRSYYRWMTYVPLAITFPRMIEIAAAHNVSISFRRLAFAAACCSLFLGIPFRTLAALPDWRARSTGPIDRAAAAIVQPADVVVCSHKAYFAIRPHSRLLFAFGLPARGEFWKIKDFPKGEVSLLCTLPEDTQKIMALVDDRWVRVQLDPALASPLSRSRYDVEFYRPDPRHGIK